MGNKTTPWTVNNLVNSKKNGNGGEEIDNVINSNNVVVDYVERFMTRRDADQLFAELDDESSNIEWGRGSFNAPSGKIVSFPRLTAAFGNDGKTYSYSGNTQKSQIWLPGMLKLKKKVEEFVSGNKKRYGEESCDAISFNYALVQLYKDGDDYIGWHSDKEGDMVKGAPVVSISLGSGAEREFQFRKRVNEKSGASGGANETISRVLKHGSMLIMARDCQKVYKHQLPKRKKIRGKRYNITFRCIK